MRDSVANDTESTAFRSVRRHANKQMTWSTKSRHARGYGAAHEKMRKHLMKTVIFCEECTRKGFVTKGTIADHKRSLAKGGDGSRENYQLLCVPCHDRKTAEDAGRSVRQPIGADGWPVTEPPRQRRR